MFVVGHGGKTWFGTGGGAFDYNPEDVTVYYAKVAEKLAYKLGAVILWVCDGASSGGRSLSSQSGDYVFDGVEGTLIPFWHYTSMFKLFADGKQGTNEP